MSYDIYMCVYIIFISIPQCPTESNLRINVFFIFFEAVGLIKNRQDAWAVGEGQGLDLMLQV